MDTQNVTTPFGRRMSLGAFMQQVTTPSAEKRQSANKWKLFRALCHAKSRLDIGDRTLAVLNALLSFHPHDDLEENQNLIVFPSNAQLSLRAHGIAEQTLRRHLAMLVDRGLILRFDSPNGKRYAHKSKEGEVRTAYGFSLAPLLRRAGEIHSLAQNVIDEQAELRRLREIVTIHRRDIAQLRENLAEINPTFVVQASNTANPAVLRKFNAHELKRYATEISSYRDELINLLKENTKSQNMCGNTAQIERHIHSSESESQIESETRHSASNADKTPVNAFDTKSDGTNVPKVDKYELPADILFTALRACPDIKAYSQNGDIRDWRDMLRTTSLVATMFNITPNTLEEANRRLGHMQTAIIIAYILQRGPIIAAPGGYLINLTRKAAAGRFSIKPLIASLLSGGKQTETLPLTSCAPEKRKKNTRYLPFEENSVYLHKFNSRE